RQGGLMFGRVAPGTTVTLDDEPVPVAADGRFAIGFGRDETGRRRLVAAPPGEPPDVRELDIAPRQWNIERVDGLPPETVTPPDDVLQRIEREAALVADARSQRRDTADWQSGFISPAEGRISGVYGSQRVLNGEPRRRHFGLDIAAPTGTPVMAPAAGIVMLAEPDLFYSGGTIIIDHGAGLSSTFLHLSEVSVTTGDAVAQGAPIGRIGATGRASGPHLDWRMNWLDRRVDPQPLLDLPAETLP
ncbi:MAG: M23 family metallopeptidase, partial [Xanthomonadales bacterium]|nr:M23 family metallopeptidase [Xanthomonadales bacterium]